MGLADVGLRGGAVSVAITVAAGPLYEITDAAAGQLGDRSGYTTAVLQGVPR